MKNWFFIFLLGITLQTYAQKAVSIDADDAAAYIPPNYVTAKDGSFELSTGTFIFDATKRMGVFNVVKSKDGAFKFKYLSEEQPDAIFETIKKFLANVSANLKDKVSIDAATSSFVERLVKQLTLKSHSLNFLRTSLYRLNESAYNGDVKPEAYAKLYEVIIKTSAELQKQELLRKVATESTPTQ